MRPPHTHSQQAKNSSAHLQTGSTGRLWPRQLVQHALGGEKERRREEEDVNSGVMVVASLQAWSLNRATCRRQMRGDPLSLDYYRRKNNTLHITIMKYLLQI